MDHNPTDNASAATAEQKESGPVSSRMYAIEHGGKHYLPTGEFRLAKVGEDYLQSVADASGEYAHVVNTAIFDHSGANGPRVILRKVPAPKVPTLELVMRMHKACYDELRYLLGNRGNHVRYSSAYWEHLGRQRAECPWLDDGRGEATATMCEKKPAETVLPLTERQRAVNMTTGHNHPVPCDGEVR